MRHKITIPLAWLAALSLLFGGMGGPSASAAASPSAASSTFTFYGSGWGHGIGLSQYGAYGLAVKGWSHKQILQHYYTGTTLGHAPSPPSTLRVGLVDAVGALHLTAGGGPVELHTGNPDGRLVGKIPRGSRWTVRPSSGKFLLLNAKGKKVGTVGGPRWNLYARFIRGSRVSISEAGYTYDLGYMEFNVYRVCSGCNYYLRAIAVASPQQYLYGVAEVSTSWPSEALKTQADASRSYAFYTVGALGQHRSGCNCGLHANTIDETYRAYSKEIERHSWIDAVNHTGGQVVLYKGHVISANFSASSGGYTDSNENVWGGNPIPYLRAVCDPGDYNPINPLRIWKAKRTGRDIGSGLARYGYSVGTVTGFPSTSRDVSGRLRSVVVRGTGGSDGKRVRVPGSVFAGALGLLGDRVWINVNKNIVGPIRGEYDSQMCAPGMAASPAYKIPGGVVQQFARGAIYRNLGIGRSLWIHGPIYVEYRDVNGSRGPLGLPRSEVVAMGKPTPCGRVHCRKALFRNGRIYFKERVGAHELHGPVLSYFLKHNGVVGQLGFPTTDVLRNSAGATRVVFEGGTVTCPKAGSCSKS